jgi:predicted PurR-regulated permease PerM
MEAFKLELAAQILTGLALVAVLKLGLLSALLSGLLIYELVHLVALKLNWVGVTHDVGKAVALILLASLIAVAISIGGIGLLALLTGGSEGLVVLLQKMAEVIETARIHFPPWAWDYLPANTEELEVALSQWLRAHAGQLQQLGQNIGTVLAHTLIGMIIGGMVAFRTRSQALELPPLTRALTHRAVLLGNAFRRIVFAQVRISALNTVLTALYLAVLLPMLGTPLPLTKTMIALTFVVGLLPVLGNLISNTVIVVVSLSVSLLTAISSLVFLVVIHKLEYFVNARIIGAKIGARAWELLLAMLIMDACFGLPGVIAAPIYYAYLKDELSARKLI